MTQERQADLRRFAADALEFTLAMDRTDHDETSSRAECWARRERLRPERDLALWSLHYVCGLTVAEIIRTVTSDLLRARLTPEEAAAAAPSEDVIRHIIGSRAAPRSSPKPFIGMDAGPTSVTRPGGKFDD